MAWHNHPRASGFVQIGFPPLTGWRMKLSDLKQFLNKRVILRMSDGEIATVRVDFVDEEYDDIIADVLGTTRPAHYGVPDAAYTFAAADIVSVEIAGDD